MSQSILILKASPRERGNSALLAERTAEGARQAGAMVESIYLHSLDIRPCDACDLCRENDGECVIPDDMQSLYPRLRAADAIVIATPVYWFTLSAQAKLFIDRWYALLGEKPNPAARQALRPAAHLWRLGPANIGRHPCSGQL